MPVQHKEPEMDSSSNDPSKLALLKSQSLNSPRVVMGKPTNIRKMSTMPEEESSEDLHIIDGGIQTTVIPPGHNEVDSDCPSDHERERGRLLSSGSRRIMITPASTGSIGSGSNGTGIKRSGSRNGSSDSIHEQGKISRRREEEQVGRNYIHGLYRENSAHGGRISRGIELYGGRHRYPSMRSLKSNATDDHHHPPASSWASIVFSDMSPNQSPARGPFPDSVSIRSLASIGMGSSDGRKLTIRRVPTSPSELLNMVHPPT